MTENLNLTTAYDIQNLSDATPKIAIIGAGLTGLMTAHLLEQAFVSKNRTLNIVIFEKSAGVGRLATRYKNPEDNRDQQWQFDFGAQFFTAKSQSFQDYLQPLLAQGVIEPWLAKTATINSTTAPSEIKITGQWDSDQPRYIGSPKMTSFGRHLAAVLKHTKIHYRTRVAPLAQSEQTIERTQTHNKTSLVDIEGNDLGVFDWVICTAPQQQAIELLQQTDFVHLDRIKQPKMLACYTLMLGWESLSDLPQTLSHAQWGMLQVNEANAIVNRVFVEHHKPGRESILPSITVHAANQWSEAQVDEDMTVVQNQLLQAVHSLLDWEDKTAPKLVDCHRWRYAATEHTNDNESSEISYVDDNKQWVVTGDWCDEGRIESCFKAATNVVQTIAV